jgi:outer membrane protein assembly factor BamB
MLCALVCAPGSAHAWLSAMGVTGDFGGSVTDLLVLPDGDVVAVANGDDDAEGSVARFAADTGARTILPFDGVCPRPTAIARLSAGDVVVSGSRNGNCDFDPGYFTVIRYDGATGVPLWSFDARGRSRALVAGPNDMLVAGGSSFGLELAEGGFAVVRFDASTGTPLWTFVTDGDRVRSLALDPAGNAIAGGSLGAFDVFGVVALARATGVERWRHEGTKEGRVTSVTVDAAGDVIAAGWYREQPTIALGHVVKLAGDDGEVLWSRTTPVDASSSRIALAANGDAIVAGSACNPTCRWTVERLAANDGATVWSLVTTVEGRSGDVAVADDGDVLVTGQTPAGMTVLRLDGADGTVDWRTDLEPFCPGEQWGSGGSVVRAAAGGNVAAGGGLCRDPIEIDSLATVVLLRGNDGTLLGQPTTTTIAPTTSTTTSTVAPDLCGRMRAAGCMGTTAQAFRRRLAAVCDGVVSPVGIDRRLARRAVRLAKRGRLDDACARVLAPLGRRH